MEDIIVQPSNVNADANGGNEELGELDLSSILVQTLHTNVEENQTTKQYVGKVLIKNASPTVPNDLDEHELTQCAKQFGPGQRAVQYSRIHCTACNLHLGSAPNEIKNRFVHPLLRVIICKSCYDFYTSGDFDKDEDGSELYCRWCGQGGNVLCCASCPFVFCKKCIRTNMGHAKFLRIRDSEEWYCFDCNPEQFITHRVLCWKLYEYTQNQIKLNQNLDIDFSTCCIGKLANCNPPPKRPHKSSGDESENDYVPSKKKKRPSILQNALKNSTNFKAAIAAQFANEPPQEIVNVVQEPQEEDEVICTPDLSMMVNDEDEPQFGNTPVLPQLPSLMNHNPTININWQHPPAIPNNIDPNVRYMSTLNNFPQIRPRIIDAPMPRSFLLVPNSSLMKPPPTTNGQHESLDLKSLLDNKITTYMKPPGKPLKVTKIPYVINTSTQNLVSGHKVQNVNRKNTCTIYEPPITKINIRQNTVILTGKPTGNSKLAPGHRYEWFQTATELTANLNRTLTSKLVQLSQDQVHATSVVDLANVHNSLQQVLSDSINGLQEIRKNLRTNFLEGLQKLKFVPAESEPAANLEPFDAKAEPPRPPAGGYIKVKSFARLNCTETIDITGDSYPIVSSDPPPAPPETEPPPLIPIVKKTPEPEEDPQTAFMIKQAIFESKFDELVANNMQVITEGIADDDKKKMLSVRVCAENNYGKNTLHTRPLKGFKPFDVKLDIEDLLSSSIVLNKQKLFDMCDKFLRKIKKDKETTNDSSTQEDINDDPSSPSPEDSPPLLDNTDNPTTDCAKEGETHTEHDNGTINLDCDETVPLLDNTDSLTDCAKEDEAQNELENTNINFDCDKMFMTDAPVDFPVLSESY